LALGSTNTNNAGGFGGVHSAPVIAGPPHSRDGKKKTPAGAGGWAAIKKPAPSKNNEMATQEEYAPPLAAT